MSKDPNIVFNEQGMKNFLSQSSFAALLAFYAFYIAYSTRKGFTFGSIEKKVDYLSNDYCLACFVLIKSLGLIDRAINRNTAEEIITVTYYDELLGKHVRDYVYEKAEKVDNRRMDSKEPAELTWKRRIELLEEYFV